MKRHRADAEIFALRRRHTLPFAVRRTAFARA